MSAVGACSRALLLAAALASSAFGSEAARAETLTGRVVNGTTKTTGHADRVQLLDVTQGMQPLQTLSDVDGDFRFEEVSVASGGHLLLQVQSGGVLYTQSLRSIDPDHPVEVTVYDSSQDRSGVSIAAHQVVFQRNDEHMEVAELYEFENASDPPVSIRQEHGPILVHVPAEVHGEVSASVGSGSMPINRPLIATGKDGLFSVDYALKPGYTRLVIRYLLGYENERLEWRQRFVYPVAEHGLLVSPEDIEVSAEGLIPRDSEVAGYARWAGLALAAGDEMKVVLSGGSRFAADPHAGSSEGDASTSNIEQVLARPNRLANGRTFIMLGMGMLLVVALLLSIQGQPRALSTALNERDDKLRHQLYRLADRYVSGEIGRSEYESERDRLLSDRFTKAKRNRSVPSRPTVVATPKR